MKKLLLSLLLGLSVNNIFADKQANMKALTDLILNTANIMLLSCEIQNDPICVSTEDPSYIYLDSMHQLIGNLRKKLPSVHGEIMDFLDKSFTDKQIQIIFVANSNPFLLDNLQINEKAKKAFENLVNNTILILFNGEKDLIYKAISMKPHFEYSKRMEAFKVLDSFYSEFIEPNFKNLKIRSSL